MAGRKDIDWDAIERAYRVNELPITKIAEKYGVNAASIHRRAKKENWTQDLAVAVKATTKALGQKRIAEDARAMQESCNTADATVVELNAISNALLIAEHEKGATVGRELMVQIMGRAKKMIDESPKSVAGALELCGDDDEYLRRELRKLIALPTIVNVVKTALDGHEKAVNQERKARNLDDLPPPKDDTAVESLLETMQSYVADAD